MFYYPSNNTVKQHKHNGHPDSVIDSCPHDDSNQNDEYPEEDDEYSPHHVVTLYHLIHLELRWCQVFQGFQVYLAYEPIKRNFWQIGRFHEDRFRFAVSLNPTANRLG